MHNCDILLGYTDGSIADFKARCLLPRDEGCGPKPKPKPRGANHACSWDRCSVFGGDGKVITRQAMPDVLYLHFIARIELQRDNSEADWRSGYRSVNSIRAT